MRVSSYSLTSISLVSVVMCELVHFSVLFCFRPLNVSCLKRVTRKHIPAKWSYGWERDRNRGFHPDSHSVLVIIDHTFFTFSPFSILRRGSVQTVG